MRKFEKKTEYVTTDKDQQLTNIREDYSVQCSSDNIESSNGDTTNFYLPVLGADEDVFSELPNEIYDNCRIKYFINVLKMVISETDLENITLSRLHASKDESGITIEWIFNYFRAYFSFENNGEDSYGMVENNKEAGVFNNFFRVLQVEEYGKVAHSVVDYIIMMGGFN